MPCFLFFLLNYVFSLRIAPAYCECIRFYPPYARSLINAYSPCIPCVQPDVAAVVAVKPSSTAERLCQPRPFVQHLAVLGVILRPATNTYYPLVGRSGRRDFLDTIISHRIIVAPLTLRTQVCRLLAHYRFVSVASSSVVAELSVMYVYSVRVVRCNGISILTGIYIAPLEQRNVEPIVIAPAATSLSHNDISDMSDRV